MKTIFKYAFVALFAVLSLASCGDDYEYTPADPKDQGGNANIEVADTAYTFLPGEKQVVSFIISRIDSTKADTVNLHSSSEHFPVQPVIFKAGEARKTVTVEGSLAVGQSEKVTIDIADADAFLYGTKEIHFSVSVYRSYNGTITSNLSRKPFSCVFYDLTGGDFMIPGAYEAGYNLKFHIDFTTNLVTAQPQLVCLYSQDYGRLLFNATASDKLIHGHYDPETLTVSLEDMQFALPDINKAFSGTYTEYYTFETDPNAQ